MYAEEAATFTRSEGASLGLTDDIPTWLPAMGCITTARIEALGQAMADATGPFARAAPSFADR